MIQRPTVDPALRDAVARALAGFSDVAVGYVFGSVSRGQDRFDSDLDVGVVLQEGITLGGVDAAKLAAAISRQTGFESVDVVDLAAQGSIFAHDVLCDAALVYEADPSRRVDFESETFSRAFDFRPTYEIATSGKISALRRWLEERYDL